MADRKISTRFLIEGENEYKNAVKGINNELKTLSSEMARTKSECQNQANSMEALSKTGDVLKGQYDAQARKVEEMRSALQNSKQAQEEWAEKLAASKDRVGELNDRLEALKTAEGDTAEEQAKLTAELERAERAQDAAQRAYDQCGSSVDYWQRSLNYAERDLNNLNAEIQRNDGLLAEAKASADGCATSIDQYGKAMGEAGGATNALGQIGSAVFGNLGGLLGSGGLLGFAVKLIDTVKELAVEYNASQSSMAIATGATGDELQALNDELTAVMANAKSARGDVAGVMGALYTQLGLRGTELEQYTADIEEFSRATGTDMGQAVNTVTQILTAYGKKASDIPAILDKLTVAHQNSRSGALALGQGLVDAGFYADTYGMSLDDVLSMMAAFDLAGVDSNLVLRALRKSYDDLSEGGQTFQQVLAGMRDGTISEADAISMFGPKADKMVKYIRDGTVDVDKFAGKLKDAAGATSTAAKEAETFGQKIKGFWNSIWNGGDIGSQYTGFYETVTGQNEEIVESVETVARSLGDLGAELLGMMGDFDGTAASIENMLRWLQEGDGQALSSQQGYETLVGTLAELKGGYAALEAQQAQAAAEIHKTVEQLTANFNDLSKVTAKDVGDMIAALSSQEKYMQDYAKNMQAAAKKGVNDGLLKSLQDGSVQSAEILAGLAEATDEEIAALNEQWEKTEEGKQTFEETLLGMREEFDQKAAELEARYEAAVQSFNQSSLAMANGAATIQGAIDGARSREADLVAEMGRIGLAGYRAYMAGLKGEGYSEPGSTRSAAANPEAPTFAESVGQGGGLYEITDRLDGVIAAIENKPVVTTELIGADLGYSANIDRLAGG